MKSNNSDSSSSSCSRDCSTAKAYTAGVLLEVWAEGRLVRVGRTAAAAAAAAAETAVLRWAMKRSAM
jgi:hypothetical protein